MSPQPNTVHLPAAATSSSRNEFTLAKGLPDAQGNTCRNGDHGSRTCRTGFVQVGCIRGKRNSVLQNLWTKDLDEYLLHLHNVAQLKWGDLINYFPAMTPSAIKCRHKQLSETKETKQDVGDQHSARFEKRGTAASPTASASGKCEPKITKHYDATSGLPAMITLAKPYSALHRRRKTGHAKNAKVTTSPALPTRESTPQRSSRCGRLIRHPFRHRPQEGYL